MTECLICQYRNENAQPLCTRCGSPLPRNTAPGPDPAKRHPLHRRSGLPKLVVVFALGLGCILALFFWHQRSKVVAKSLIEQLPAGASMVAGVNIASIRSHSKIKKWVEFPATQLFLNFIKNNKGVDLMGLRTATGGVYHLNDKVHLLAVVHGQFQVTKLENWFTGTDVVKEQVGGHDFWQADMSDLDGADDIAPIVLGMVDDERLVVGSKTLVERYLKGTAVGSMGFVKTLMSRVDERAFAWSVGRLKESLQSVWWIAAPLLGSEAPEALLDLEFLYTLHVRQAIEAQMTLICSTDESADLIQGIMGTVKSDLPEPLGSSITLDVSKKGREVIVSATIPIPEFPLH